MKNKVDQFKDMLNRQKTASTEATAASFSDQDTLHPTDGTIHLEDAGQNAPAAESTPSDELVALQNKAAELEHAAQEQREHYLRQLAETENFKKRLEKESIELRKFAVERLLQDLLPVLDNLGMTLTHSTNKDDPLVQGVQMTLKQFVDILERQGVQVLAGEGEKFDPNKQEAIGTGEKEGIASGHVITVHRKGFALNGKVIRAAMVTVAG